MVEWLPQFVIRGLSHSRLGESGIVPREISDSINKLQQPSRWIRNSFLQVTCVGIESGRVGIWNHTSSSNQPHRTTLPLQIDQSRVREKLMGRLILTVQDFDAQFPIDAALIASVQHPWVVTKSVLEQEFL